ncbi:MAG: BolA family protein [Mariprofundaceae bacterium]|nr:BolA family protein [Mariprofundaceae bacterium]
MSPRSDKIHAILTQAFQPSSLQVEDESWKHAGHAGVKESGGGHFVVHITAAVFSEKSRITCHRMINHALKDEFGAVIHALSIHAKSA